MSNRLSNVFRALRYRNFRLFFMGQSVSLVGTWMQQIAMSWLVYRLTGSAFMLGLTAFASQIPSFALSPIAGVMCDRWDRHKTLIVTQALAMAQAFLLAALAITGAINVPQIIALALLLGSINALEIPVRQSFLIDMVERKELLGNAIAINSSMFNAARLIGPSIAGLVIAAVGEGPCFFINGLSFLAVIASLLMMRLKKKEPKLKGQDIVSQLKDGVKYVFGFAPIRHLLILLSVICMIGMAYAAIMPVFAKTILGGSAETLGFLMASGGVGAFIATIFLAARDKMLRLGRIIPVSAASFSLSLIAFSYSRDFWLSMVLLAVAGFGFMVLMAATNTILQTITDDDKRGRVMSFYAMAFMGVAPIGSIMAGSLTSTIGVTNTLAIGGVACLAASAYFAVKMPELKKLVHPIYDRLAVSSALNTISELTVPPED